MVKDYIRMISPPDCIGAVIKTVSPVPETESHKADYHVVGIDFELIAQITGLTVETIEKL